MNSPISWVGGKKSLRDMIYQRLPKDFGRYIEVFGGGGWVLFGRKPSTVMEVYNDFNSDLANMFRCIRDRPMALLKELGFLPLNGRDEFNVLKKFLEKDDFTNEYLQEEIEIAQHYLSAPQFDEIKLILLENAQMNDVKRAAAFYKLIRLSYGSGCTSYGCQPFDIRKTFDLIWQASRRLKDTVIENKDFEASSSSTTVNMPSSTATPPYYQTEGHYEVVFKKEDHYRLRDTLAACLGRWLVSYNDCEFVRELYKDFNIEAVTRINNLAQRYDNGCEYAEVLISNYDTGERIRDMPLQMGLFDMDGLFGTPEQNQSL